MRLPGGRCVLRVSCSKSTVPPRLRASSVALVLLMEPGGWPSREACVLRERGPLPLTSSRASSPLSGPAPSPPLLAASPPGRFNNSKHPRTLPGSFASLKEEEGTTSSCAPDSAFPFLRDRHASLHYPAGHGLPHLLSLCSIRRRRFFPAPLLSVSLTGSGQRAALHLPCCRDRRLQALPGPENPVACQPCSCCPAPWRGHPVPTDIAFLDLQLLVLLPPCKCQNGAKAVSSGRLCHSRYFCPWSPAVHPRFLKERLVRSPLLTSSLLGQLGLQDTKSSSRCFWSPLAAHPKLPLPPCSP